VEQAADDLFHIVAQVHTEYEVVFTTAAFPDDTAKSTARKWYRARELDWELLRCVYGDMKYYRTLSEAANFLHRSRFFVDVPASGLSNWKREPYANLTKLEGLNDEYWIQAIKFGRLLSDQFHSSTDTTAARSRTGRL
jgi:hypothetical protein